MTNVEERRDALIIAVLEELEALIERLDNAPEWFRGAGTGMRAAALATEVKSLCGKASVSNDTNETERLLAQARNYLAEIQAIIGVH